MMLIINRNILRYRLARSLVFVAILGGCAFSQEGAVDFRKANGMFPTQQEETANNRGENSDTGTAAPMRLIRKFIVKDDNSLIEKGDSITIRLAQAFIADFWELGIFSPQRWFRSNGEIAIVVNAFEFSPDDTSKDFDFTPEGQQKGRLVFFSNDVEKKQFLNLTNMPIYGPITYNGNPIGIAITIIEIDANSEQISAVLGTLASVGAMAYPPAAPVLPLLDSLGQALLKAGTDDIEFRFTFVLDPKTSYNGLAYPKVEAANYVFIRENNRQANTPWDKLTLDENTGRVHCLKNHSSGADTTQVGCDNDGIYRKNTYITIQINKGFDSTDIDLAQDTFTSFRAALDQVDKQKATNLDPVLKEINRLAYARVQKRNFSVSRNLLNEYNTACGEKKEGEASQAGYKLYRALKKAIETQGKPTIEEQNEAELSEQDVELLLGRLLRSADAKTEDDQVKFTIGGFIEGFDSFEKFYLMTCK